MQRRLQKIWEIRQSRLKNKKKQNDVRKQFIDWKKNNVQLDF